MADFLPNIGQMVGINLETGLLLVVLQTQENSWILLHYTEVTQSIISTTQQQNPSKLFCPKRRYCMYQRRIKNLWVTRVSHWSHIHKIRLCREATKNYDKELIMSSFQTIKIKCIQTQLWPLQFKMGVTGGNQNDLVSSPCLSRHNQPSPNIKGGIKENKISDCSTKEIGLPVCQKCDIVLEHSGWLAGILLCYLRSRIPLWLPKVCFLLTANAIKAHKMFPTSQNTRYLPEIRICVLHVSICRDRTMHVCKIF